MDIDQRSDSMIEIPKPEEFKFINSKPLTKMGIFNRK